MSRVVGTKQCCVCGKFINVRNLCSCCRNRKRRGTLANVRRKKRPFVASHIQNPCKKQRGSKDVSLDLTSIMTIKPIISHTPSPFQSIYEIMTEESLYSLYASHTKQPIFLPQSIVNLISSFGVPSYSYAQPMQPCLEREFEDVASSVEIEVV